MTPKIKNVGGKLKRMIKHKSLFVKRLVVKPNHEFHGLSNFLGGGLRRDGKHFHSSIKVSLSSMFLHDSLSGMIIFYLPRWVSTSSSVNSIGDYVKFRHPFLQTNGMFLGELICLLIYYGFKWTSNFYVNLRLLRN